MKHKNFPASRHSMLGFGLAAFLAVTAAVAQVATDPLPADATEGLELAFNGGLWDDTVQGDTLVPDPAN